MDNENSKCRVDNFLVIKKQINFMKVSPIFAFYSFISQWPNHSYSIEQRSNYLLGMIVMLAVIYQCVEKTNSSLNLLTMPSSMFSTSIHLTLPYFNTLSGSFAVVLISQEKTWNFHICRMSSHESMRSTFSKPVIIADFLSKYMHF